MKREWFVKARGTNRVESAPMSAADTVVPKRSRAGDRGDSALLGRPDFAWRVLILLNLFRLTVAFLLLTAYFVVEDPRIIGSASPRLAWVTLLGMLAVGCVELALLPKRSPSATWHLVLQFAADVAAVTLLMHASGGVSSGLGGVLVVTVGGLALLVRSDHAFLLAAVATLALLTQQTLAQWEGLTDTAEYAPTGILGAVIFVIAAVVQILRRQLVETQALAEQRGVDLRNLVELNDYIVRHLRESIVVVDGDNRVRLINESAAKHLGTHVNARGLGLASVAPQLSESLEAWRARKTRSAAFASTDGTTSIEPHFAPLGSHRRGGVLVFLEDTTLIAERVQQAKLAALGRLSASIAHEIRNPLGAMSHAGQLLAESPSLAAEDHRLTDIILLNARRVSQIVESVLALSRKAAARPEKLLLRAWLEDFGREFMQTLELSENAVRVVDHAAEIEIEMDPTHLHQIVWNLCDNAVKYASATAGAICVELSCGLVETSGRAFLDVADRGAGIAEDQAEEIFEPFYTGQAGGTGLGLYISRELAGRNGATLRYHPRPGGGSVFRILLADPHRW